MDAGPDVVRRLQVARPRLFYRAEYSCDVLEAGMRHTFDILRPQRIRDALVTCAPRVRKSSLPPQRSATTTCVSCTPRRT